MTRDQHDKELLKTLKSISASLKHIDNRLEKINSTLVKANYKEPIILYRSVENELEENPFTGVIREVNTKEYSADNRGDGLWQPGQED